MGTNFQREFTPKFKKEYNWFLDYDHETTDKINILITDILAHPTYGLGHPERLKHLGGNVWSRHIDKKNRLRYSIEGNVIYFERCRGHYDDH
ncbi:MAG: type II toxin-antitoxin system YoeB family toxin [Puniceicoccales bacterium]|jgi:toxin YoeB|nr:type II toxin-antitoxin system YoeB family toxin [Puniceicoccales bacterium]